MFSKKWKFTLNGNKGTAGADAVSAMLQMAAVWLTDTESLLEDKLKLVAGVRTLLEAAGRKHVAGSLSLNDFVAMPTEKIVLTLAGILGFSGDESEPVCDHASPEVFLLMEMLGLDALAGHKAIQVRNRIRTAKDVYYALHTTQAKSAPHNRSDSLLDDELLEDTTSPAKSYLPYNIYHKSAIR